MYLRIRSAGSTLAALRVTNLLKRRPVHTPYLCAQVHDCPKQSGSGAGITVVSSGLKRAERSAPVKLAVIPEEWFTFFHVKTGVSGGYIFLFVLTNYALSKEIFVMDHEYYIGLSIFPMLCYITLSMGAKIGAYFDKEVDEFVEDLYKGRKAETSHYESIIKDAKDAIWRAEGQKQLMDAKKENILMQLEAVYRERMMHAYHAVKGRMDYHMKRYYSEARIHQKWMIEWILREVHKAMTPEFQQAALDQSIKDLEAVASKAA